MIYKLEIENFYSFRAKQVLDLSIPLTTPFSEARFSAIFKGSKVRAPKIVALFGANGSGKSTVLKAISFMAWFVKNSFDHSAATLPVERFNDRESSERPVCLAIEFGGPMNLIDQFIEMGSQAAGGEFGLFRYELELATKSGAVTEVVAESLLQKPSGEGRWHRVFERTAGPKVLGSKQFSLSGFAKVLDKIRNNASVIATLAKFNHRASLRLIEVANRVFTNILLDKFDPNDPLVFSEMANSPKLVHKLNLDLQRIDVGVEKAEVLQTPAGPTLVFRHEGHDGKMPWALESNGTRSFIRIFPWLSTALATGGTALLDELDVSIHPLILPEILRWFYSEERNPGNAQLWMSCHAVSLLEDLVKEEIVLCEKDHRGRSTVFSLADVRPTLRKDNFYRKYMGGEYGAVPRIG